MAMFSKTAAATATTIVFGAALAVVGACAKKPTPQPNAETQETTGATMMAPADCPIAVPGANVETTETTDGMAMTFTTSGDVAELRRRVRAMGEHMNARASAYGGGMGPGMMAEADGGGRMGMGMHGRGMMAGGAGPPAGRRGMGIMPSVRCEVDDVEGGARMRVSPSDPSERGDVRRRMQEWTQTMAQGHRCPAMSGPAQP